MPRPRNVGASDAGDPALAAIRDVPAATAACLLVRRDRFLAAGGFDEAYVYGYEDVDLALRWRAAGERVVVEGRAVLWHDESATRRTQTDKATLDRQRQNLRTFNGRWGVSLFRDACREALTGERFLTSTSPSLAVIGADQDAAVARLAASLESLGWVIDRRGAAPRRDGRGPEETAGQGRAAPGIREEAVVALVVDPTVDVRSLDRHAITVGWVGRDPRAWTSTAWFDELDVVLAPDEVVAGEIATTGAKRAVVFPEPTATLLLGLLRDWVEARRFGVLVQARDWDEAPVSGDFHFARSLQRQLERRGIPTGVYLRPAWASGISTRDDVAIHLWGRYPIGPRPGQTTVLWILYHPELVTNALLDAYDVVLAASDRFAADLAARTGRPVHAVHQATDPERFHPGLEGPAHELLFVGNSRGVRRRILDDLAGTRADVAVYGRGWDPELLDPVQLHGDGVPNDELAGYYAAASIVLNDHWHEAAEAGFINNRL
jgi:hypothetical protein